MTWLEFQSICGSYLLDPNIVLEDEEIKEALKNRDDEKVKTLIQDNF